MSSTKLDQLRTAIADESIPLSERRTAAEHLITALVDAVPAPAEDDAEVVELRTPWKDDGTLGSMAPMAWRVRNQEYGWSADGPTLSQAKRHVQTELKFRALLTVVTDENAHRLEKLEACRVILDDYFHPQGFYRRNGYNAERLLEKILPTTATKWDSGSRVLVERPPKCMADVWQC